MNILDEIENIFSPFLNYKADGPADPIIDEFRAISLIKVVVYFESLVIDKLKAFLKGPNNTTNANTILNLFDINKDKKSEKIYSLFSAEPNSNGCIKKGFYCFLSPNFEDNLKSQFTKIKDANSQNNDIFNKNFAECESDYLKLKSHRNKYAHIHRYSEFSMSLAELKRIALNSSIYIQAFCDTLAIYTKDE